MPRALSGSFVGALVLVLVTGSARAATIRIKIEQLAFTPQRVTAKVGDTIEWVNGDFLAHTATARNGAWDLTIAPHATARLVLKAEGAVDYYCKFHPNMTGQVSVGK